MQYIQCYNTMLAEPKRYVMIYMLLQRYQAVGGRVGISIGEILDLYGYSRGKHKPDAYREILDILRTMQSQEIIQTSDNLDNPTYSTSLIIYYIGVHQNPKSQYTLISTDAFDRIISSNAKKTEKDNLLILYLHAASSVRWSDGNGRTGLYYGALDKVSKQYHIQYTATLRLFNLMCEIGILVRKDDVPPYMPQEYIISDITREVKKHES